MMRLIASLALVAVFAVTAVVSAPAEPLATPAKVRCLLVPAPLTRILRSSLAFSAGGQLVYSRAVKSPKVANLYFISAQIRSTDLGKKRPLGTWAVDKLDATATASPLNSAARAYSDLAAPDPGATKVTMASAGATASQKCVTKLIK